MKSPEAREYPLIAMPAVDGMPLRIASGVPLLMLRSKTSESIPNKAIRDMMWGLPAMKGIVVVGEATGQDVYKRTYEALMNLEGVPEVTFWVYDVMLRNPRPYNQRLDMVKSWVNSCNAYVQALPYRLIKTPEGLREYEQQLILEGYKGAMPRSLDNMGDGTAQ